MSNFEAFQDIIEQVTKMIVDDFEELFEHLYNNSNPNDISRIVEYHTLLKHRFSDKLKDPCQELLTKIRQLSNHQITNTDILQTLCKQAADKSRHTLEIARSQVESIPQELMQFSEYRNNPKSSDIEELQQYLRKVKELKKELRELEKSFEDLVFPGLQIHSQQQNPNHHGDSSSIKRLVEALVRMFKMLFSECTWILCQLAAIRQYFEIKYVPQYNQHHYRDDNVDNINGVSSSRRPRIRPPN